MSDFHFYVFNDSVVIYVRKLHVILLYKGCECLEDNLHVQKEVIGLSVGDVKLLALLC